MAFGEVTRCLIFGESLANGFWERDALANLWRMFFCDLTRWQILGESLANGFWGTNTLANLSRIFGEWFLRNRHVGESLANGFWGKKRVGESLANLWRMAIGEPTRWRIFVEYFSEN